MKKLRKLLLNSFLVISILSCCGKPKETENNFLQKGILKISLPKLMQNQVSDQKLYGVFLNSPYIKDLEDVYIAMYILEGNKKHLISCNKFQKDFEIFFPKNIDNQLIHFVMYVIIDNKDGTYTYYDFQDKSVIIWKNSYKYVYIGFFSNDEQKIRFIPNEDLVLQ